MITQAPRACATSGDGGHVLHFETLRARRLDQHGPGVGPHQRLDPGAGERIVITGLHAHSG